MTLQEKISAEKNIIDLCNTWRQEHIAKAKKWYDNAKAAETNLARLLSEEAAEKQIINRTINRTGQSLPVIESEF